MIKNKTGTTDTTFFTNNKNETLLDRFKKTLEYVQNFDVLVGFFRSSGFYALEKELEKVGKIRILNGIDVDKKTYDAFNDKQAILDFDNSSKIKERLSNEFKKEAIEADDNQQVYSGYQKFIKFLKSGKIEFRQHPSHKLHAKVYISRFGKPISNVSFGRVITGSSNFSHSGLEKNYEFNVELKNKTDVDFALEQFENLWNESEDITNVFIDTIQNKTWLNNNITPYEIYLKTLYEYFYEDINIDKETDFSFPDSYMDLEYQKQAVVSASKILDAYNGVFLADVVGMVKTYIAALLCQQPSLKAARKLFIVPPVLVEYWRETLTEFGVSKYHVESAGQIKNISSWDKLDEVEYVFLDEAHRFRNEDTETWKELYENICFGKKVILITATAINNKFSDLLSQIKLFQKPNRSNIPTVRNLQNFFKSWENKVEKAKSIGTQAYIEEKRHGSLEIREKVLKHLMVRRTRKEVEEFFANDLKKQNLIFPKVKDPIQIVYEFDNDVDQIFNDTINLIKNKFLKARYTPYHYLKKIPSEFELIKQENLGAFMKTMLIKRLESSFFAFNKTINRFIESHQNFIKMINSGKVMISKKVNVFDLLDEDNEDHISELIDKGDLKKFDIKEFTSKFKNDIENDLECLLEIQLLWKDVKIDPKIQTLKKYLKEDQILIKNKIVIFTESSETGTYLLDKLSSDYKEKVIFYSSKGARYFKDNKHCSSAQKHGRQLVRENFDPNIKKESQKNDFKILITTDVLAEGVNLHRSNINLNYDLPWNPTKVIQRTGRVNRVGSLHDYIYVYNFFPTKKSDDEIKQRKNIISKIQSFHDCLGSDAKILTETEEVQTFNLFGSNLYENLNNKKFYDNDEDVNNSELKYLKIIREIRDSDKKLYQKIKEIPIKSRTAKKNKIKNNSLISFFRKGKLKKFLLTGANKKTDEMTFIDAIKLFESKKNETKMNLPKEFFELLSFNKNYFEEIIDKAESENVQRRGLSIEKRLIDDLKSLRKESSLNENDHKFRNKLLRCFEDGVIARMRSKAIRAEIDKNKIIDGIKLLQVFRKNISDKFIDESLKDRGQYAGKKEIILSEFII